MSGRVAIVTGGTFGIGAAISLALARQGWRVLTFGLETRQPPSIAERGGAVLRTRLAEEGLSAEVIEADVSRAEDVVRVVDHAVALFGRIDALVNNAAIGPLGNVLETSPEIWDRVLAVNLRGAYLCSRQVLRPMISQGGGTIVNVGSGAGWGKPNMAAYCASKGGLFALTMAMAYDHFADHVRVNLVIPGGGGIITGMSLGRANERPAGPPTRREAVPGTVAGRPATSEDVAGVVAFLLSDAAATISGTVIDVGCFAHQGGPVARPRPGESQP